MIKCKRCGSKKVFTETKGSQTGIYCSECGKWIKWGTKEEIRLIRHTYSSKWSDREKLEEIENIVYKFKNQFNHTSPMDLMFEIMEVLDR